MRVTLDIDDDRVDHLQSVSGSRIQTMSSIVEEALRLYLERRWGDSLPPLPSFEGGGYLVDIADRDALNGLMDRP